LFESIPEGLQIVSVEDGKQRKLELTLDHAVKNMQVAWNTSRYAQLYAFHAAVPALEIARANPDDFRVYCQDRSVGGDLPETQVAELLIQNDPDADAISRERRAEYGAAIGWFADRNLCPEMDAEKAVQCAIQKGRIKGIAELYRSHKNAQNPDAAASKKRAKRSKTATATQAELRTRCRTDYLVEEFRRKLDEAGVVPCLPENLPDFGVGLFLVIGDPPSGQPRMFEIRQTDAKYRLLLDTIIKQHVEKRTTAQPA
jgi:hypothetical protein